MRPSSLFNRGPNVEVKKPYTKNSCIQSLNSVLGFSQIEKFLNQKRIINLSKITKVDLDKILQEQTPVKPKNYLSLYGAEVLLRVKNEKGGDGFYQGTLKSKRIFSGHGKSYATIESRSGGILIDLKNEQLDLYRMSGLTPKERELVYKQSRKVKNKKLYRNQEIRALRETVCQDFKSFRNAPYYKEVARVLEKRPDHFFRSIHLIHGAKCIASFASGIGMVKIYDAARE
jgi:hypothetical protein